MLLLAALLLGGGARAPVPIYVINNYTDAATLPEGELNLRLALTYLNATPRGAEIHFDPKQEQTISLTGSLPEITKPVVITNLGPRVTLAGDGVSSIFEVAEEVSYFQVENLRFLAGAGAIVSRSPVTLVGCRFDSTSGGSRSAVQVIATTLHVERCHFSDNSGTADGASINAATSDVRVEDSFFDGGLDWRPGGMGAGRPSAPRQSRTRSESLRPETDRRFKRDRMSIPIRGSEAVRVPKDAANKHIFSEERK